MVERLQDLYFVEEYLGLLDVLLVDLFDGPPFGSALLFALVDDTVGALAELLS